jgi:hypothetical protein
MSRITEELTTEDTNKEVTQENEQEAVEVAEGIEDAPENTADNEEGEGTEDQQEEVAAVEDAPEEVTIDGVEEESPNDSAAFRKLREAYRQQVKRTKELEKLVPVNQSLTLRPKPKIEDEGIDYDPEVFTKALDDWHEEKSKFDFQEQTKQKLIEAQNQAYQNKVTAFEQSKSQFKQPDFEEMVALTTQTLTKEQIAIIIDTAKNPALVKYALGKNPSKLAELAKMDNNLVHFTVAVTRLEEQIKMAKKPITTPERKLTSSTPMSSNTLERLRAEAAKTGDYTQVVAWKKKHLK